MIDETDVGGLLGHKVVDREGLRRRTHLVPVEGLETGNGTLKVPWTKDRVKESPQYSGGAKGSILGLGDYRPAISESKEREAYAYYWKAENQ